MRRIGNILLLLLLTAHCSASLEQLKDSILHYYNEIHKKQTDKPTGIWYSNTLATLLGERYQNLFSKDWTGYSDEELFKKTASGIFQLRKGRLATEACQRVIDGVSIMDCGNVSQLVYYLSLSDQMGKEAFDTYVEKSEKPLYIATYTNDAPKDSILFDFLQEVKIASPSKENHRPLTLCQLCYFRNYPAYLIKHPTGNAQGYNSIYLGYNEKGEQHYISFWGSGPKTEQEIIALLKEKYDAPQDEWDLLYLKEHPEENKAYRIDPNHQFFDDGDIFSYIIK